jgi:type IV secretion system protein VirD4
MLPLPEEDVATAQESNSSEPDILENFPARVYQTPGLQG